MKKGLKDNSDVYSLGILFFFLLSGKSPYSYSDLIELQLRQKECAPDSTKLSSNATSLLRQMLCFRVQDRISLQGLLEELQTSLGSISNMDDSRRQMAISEGPNGNEKRERQGWGLQ